VDRANDPLALLRNGHAIPVVVAGARLQVGPLAVLHVDGRVEGVVVLGVVVGRAGGRHLQRDRVLDLGAPRARDLHAPRTALRKRPETDGRTALRRGLHGGAPRGLEGHRGRKKLDRERPGVVVVLSRLDLALDADPQR
jgi:hypothetical protein